LNGLLWLWGYRAAGVRDKGFFIPDEIAAPVLNVGFERLDGELVGQNAERASSVGLGGVASGV